MNNIKLYSKNEIVKANTFLHAIVIKVNFNAPEIFVDIFLKKNTHLNILFKEIQLIQKSKISF